MIDINRQFYNEAGKPLTDDEEMILFTSLRWTERKLAHFPPDTPRQTVERFEATRKRILDRIVRANIRLVYKVAAHYEGGRCDYMDLVQEGASGILRAAEDYDHRRGRFTTYAHIWIRRYISHHRWRNSLPVRIPDNHQAAYLKLQRAWTEFEAEHSRDPSRAELAQYAGVRQKTADWLWSYLLSFWSLDQTMRRTWKPDRVEDRTPHDIIDDGRETAEERVIAGEQASAIYDAIGDLPRQDAQIVEMYHGLNGYGGATMTQREIAEIIGMTQQNVALNLRRTEKLLKLRLEAR